MIKPAWKGHRPANNILCKRVSNRLDNGGSARHSHCMQNESIAFNGVSRGLPAVSPVSPTEGRYVLQEDSHGNRIACRWDKGTRSGYVIPLHSTERHTVNTYAAFYRGRSIGVNADSSYAAQVKAAAIFKARKSYDVTVVLAAKDGTLVTHSTASL